MHRHGFSRVAILGLAAGLGSFSGLGQAAQGATINFDSQPNGKVINNQYFISSGVMISADNFTVGHPDLAITFDTTRTGTADDDLQQPWTVGNLAPGAKLKNILIIAENQIDNNHDGLIDSPDDEGGSRPAGVFKFKFKSKQSEFGLDLIDIEGASEIGPDRGYLSFRTAGVETGRVSFGAFVDPTSPYYDRTVVYGNNSANHIKPITAGSLRLTSFDEVDVNMGWSSAIDNITFDNGLAVVIPEPACLALAALPMLLARRRRMVA